MSNYKDLSRVDLNLRLQSGSIIKVENLSIKPYTLEEIKEYGYTNYMKNLQWISITIDDFIESIIDDEKRKVLEEQRANLKTFDFYLNLGGQELLDGLIDAIGMIFRTDDVIVLNQGIAIDFVKIGVMFENNDGNMVIDEEYLKSFKPEELAIIHKDNFDDIVNVIKIQNYMTKPKENENKTNPVDEETRKLLELMEKNRKKVEAKKKAQKKIDDVEDDIDVSDIISAVSSKSNSINKLNIWYLTLYQLYDEYSRLELIDNYDFSIRAMMAGAEKVDLKHWSSKL